VREPGLPTRWKVKTQWRQAGKCNEKCGKTAVFLGNYLFENISLGFSALLAKITS